MNFKAKQWRVIWVEPLLTVLNRQSTRQGGALRCAHCGGHTATVYMWREDSPVEPVRSFHGALAATIILSCHCHWRAHDVGA